MIRFAIDPSSLLAGVNARWDRCRALAVVIGLLGTTTGLAAKATPAQSQTCTQEQIATAQDQGSAALRRLNAASTPQIDSKLRELQKSRGWSDHDLDEKAYEQLEDDTIRAFDGETATLITRMETLSEPSSPVPTCERLLEMRQTLDRLRDISQQKSRHLLTKLDSELGRSPPRATASAASPQTPSAPPVSQPVQTAQPSQSTQPEAQPPISRPQPQAAKSLPQVVAAAPPPPAPAPAPSAPPGPWTTTSRGQPPAWSPQSPSAAIGTQQQPAAGPPAAGPPVSGPPSDDPPAGAEQLTYSRAEIQATGQGFFGKVSAGLATVLDFAFQKAGSPTGYILGKEGGGAFLAGVRYGEGNLHIKGQPPVPIFWRGPSIGYDVGAAGSNLMVLIYNVRDPNELFVNFAGVEGSAFLVGGIGMTFMTNGKKIMAPIRSGIGVRLGANIGYLKFSHKASWNPF